MVSLSRNNSLGMINSEKVQVLRVADLCDNILARHGTLSKENMDKVLDILEELRAGRFKQDEEAVHVVDPCLAPPISKPTNRNLANAAQDTILVREIVGTPGVEIGNRSEI
jgi:hypothetical protein